MELSADSNVKEAPMNQQLITALYCRLSIEDDNDGDSNSIQNQRILLSTYANEQKFPNQRFFVEMLTTTLIQMHPTCTQTAP